MHERQPGKEGGAVQNLGESRPGDLAVWTRANSMGSTWECVKMKVPRPTSDLPSQQLWECGPVTGPGSVVILMDAKFANHRIRAGTVLPSTGRVSG